MDLVQLEGLVLRLTITRLRKNCDAHLLFNASWLVSNFCMHQMLMKDSMHQINLGIIVCLIMAILNKYWEYVLQYFPEGNEGLAAQKPA